MPSSRSWGIGEIGDIPVMAAWMTCAGQRVLQLLPINEVPVQETSPYSALSAMAIDPQFISVASLEDFEAIGGESALDADLQHRLRRVRQAPVIDYANVRRLKRIVLRRAFERFRAHEWERATSRAASLRDYVREQAWWLDEYALFRALHARYDESPWMSWPAALRDRQPDALATARAELADDVLYRQYLQWLAGDQWAVARAGAGDVALFGDLPFMVSGDSADVWSRQDEFRLDASVGVPPDAFSETGQDWSVPVYRWDVVASRGYGWLRDRARRSADLFGGYRVDHLVGFYRTYFRPHDGGVARFTPEDERAQVRQGEAVMDAIRTAGAEIIAEDLGVVPDFVRASLARQGIPGYKVMRWEREWDREEDPFVDPATYPALSVATSGTHDTEPMAIWWDTAPAAEREAVLAIPSIAQRLSSEDRARACEARPMSADVRDALIEALYASGSNLVILPVHDAFGWRDRINQPGTISDANWTWRLPWPVDRLAAEGEAVVVATKLRELGSRYNR